MNKSQLKFLFFMLILAAAMPLFAEVMPEGLKSTADEIEAIFRGPVVTIILICCLAGCGIAYAFNKDNEKMKRNIIAIAIGIIIVSAARGIVEAVIRASK